MKRVDVSGCRVQVLICTNERPDERVACHQFGGQEFYLAVKEKLKLTGLRATHWATRTGCLGFCNSVGTTVAIHRDGQPARWFTEVTASDFDFIWQEIVRE